MSRTDFSPEEEAFRRDIESAVKDARSAAGPCPHPDLLLAAASGVLSESAESVRRHTASCAVCEQLTRDLLEYEFPGVSADEDQRIRTRWAAGKTVTAVSRLRGWFRQPVWIAIGAAAGVLLSVALWNVPWTATRPPLQVVEQSGPADPNPITPIPSRKIFILEKAVIKIPATAVLVLRSGESGKGFLDGLAAALEPYRSDNYLEAIQRLEMLSRKYPDAAEPAYYRGVSQLMLGVECSCGRILASCPRPR